jgi:hypothetical protein
MGPREEGIEHWSPLRGAKGDSCMALTRINNERRLLDGTQVGDWRKDSIILDGTQVGDWRKDSFTVLWLT